ncbi:hypothetical protein [Parafrankia discariae]|uniref:hypothetical protein n=1 Tax=Parafrankia discariae TaxID=365528 RepID=UPI0003665DC5|nr:hypothetical protein [Parafrankia discariae]
MILEAIALVGCLAAFGFVAAIWVALLTFVLLADWFRERQHKIQKKRRKAISMKANKEIKKALDDGDVTHVTGIFEPGRDELIEVQPWSADDVDARVRQAHRNSQVVVWS